MVNWWLFAPAFILGLGLTLLLVVRRVQREVPDADAPAGEANPGGATSFAGGRSGAESEPAAQQRDDEQ